MDPVDGVEPSSSDSKSDRSPVRDGNGGADERTRTSCRCAYETRVPPRVVSVAGVGIEPTDSERMKLVSHRCSIPAASSPGVEPGTQPSEGRDRPTTKSLSGTGISRRSRTSRAGFVNLLSTVDGDVASHGGIEPTVVGLRIQRPRPLDECDKALPARVDRAALRLEDAGPGRGRKHSRRAAESNRAPWFCRPCRSRNRAPSEQATRIELVPG